MWRYVVGEHVATSCSRDATCCPKLRQVYVTRWVTFQRTVIVTHHLRLSYLVHCYGVEAHNEINATRQMKSTGHTDISLCEVTCTATLLMAVKSVF
jgi:hypothetical protein